MIRDVVIVGDDYGPPQLSGSFLKKLKKLVKKAAPVAAMFVPGGSAIAAGIEAYGAKREQDKAERQARQRIAAERAFIGPPEEPEDLPLDIGYTERVDVVARRPRTAAINPAILIVGGLALVALMLSGRRR